MPTNKPWLIIISGPNGAGKTTFHDRILEQNPFFKNALFANSDIEFSKLVLLPENQSFIQELEYNIKQTTENIRKKLLNKFKKTMDSISGNINERIERKNEGNKTFWQEQFALSAHIPTDQEYIVYGLISKNDLMHRISSPNVHERINAKADKNNWYKTYKKYINTIEVQEALYLQPIKEKLNKVYFCLQRRAAETTLSKIQKAFENGSNIIFETTGAGNMGARFAYKARTCYHYNVYGFYPYLLRPELSIARVNHRVENGGHNVPKDTVLERYDKSLHNLPTSLKEVDVGIVMDNSGKKPFMPVFAHAHGYIVDFAKCPEYLQSARQQMIEKLPQKSVKELLHLQQDVDITKMTEEQREIFGQIIISTLLGQIR